MKRGSLTPTEVYEIRRFCDEGWTRKPGNRRAIALAYGICKPHVYAIGQRDVWMSLPEEADSRWGSRRGRPPATPQQVRLIRRFYDEGIHLRQRGIATHFARRLGLSMCTVGQIGRRQSYRSVPEEGR